MTCHMLTPLCLVIQILLRRYKQKTFEEIIIKETSTLRLPILKRQFAWNDVPRLEPVGGFTRHTKASPGDQLAKR